MPWSEQAPSAPPAPPHATSVAQADLELIDAAVSAQNRRRGAPPTPAAVSNSGSAAVTGLAGSSVPAAAGGMSEGDGALVLTAAGGKKQGKGKGQAALRGGGEETGLGLVGRAVRVYWPLDDAWYVANVYWYDARSNKHLVRYWEDGVVEEIDFGTEQIDIQEVQGKPEEVAAKQEGGMDVNLASKCAAVLRSLFMDTKFGDVR